MVTTLSEIEVRDRRFEICALDTGEVATVLEVLSPTNKVGGSEGRNSFLAKRREITASPAHGVEIDLLRAGLSLELRKRLDPHEYFVHVSPVELRPKGRVWPIRLQDRLPTIRIPLRVPDPDAPLDLQLARVDGRADQPDGVLFRRGDADGEAAEAAAARQVSPARRRKPAAPAVAVNLGTRKVNGFDSEVFVFGVPDADCRVVLQAVEREVPLGGRVF